MIRCQIADLLIDFDYDNSLFYKEYELFLSEQGGKPDCVFRLKQGILSVPRLVTEWMQFPGFRIGYDKNHVYICYENEPCYRIHWIVYERDFSIVTYYYDQGQIEAMTDDEKKRLAEYLFWFQREAFFLCALYHEGISIHSSSILYNTRGVSFSAMSQTGKSTHADLWKQCCNTPILDGDVTVCRILDSKPYIYGLPWCGTSGQYLNQKVELEAVVFLRQADTNRVKEISDSEKFQHLFARSFTPLWNRELVKKRIDLTQRMIHTVPQMFELECKPDREAVYLCKEKIDHEWSSKGDA